LLRDRWEIPSVDQVMVEESAGASAKRSAKTSEKLQGLKLAISMMDLTTLEGKDTPGKIASLCRKAMRPLGPRYEVPSCSAVCVYQNLVRVAKRFLGNSSVKVASFATAFPTGLMPLRLKLEEVRSAAWTRKRQDRHGHRSRRFSGGRIWSYERTKHHTD
jgi:deoxyribose-phosphate aldolase